MTRQIITTKSAPAPAGHYSQAIRAAGSFVFVAGQTPRTADGNRLTGASFADQARQTMDNLEAIAHAANLTLKDAVKINVFLRRLEDRTEFDRIYASYMGDAKPARLLVQSEFSDFDIEVDAILLDPK
jgi:2-iminobutanoate/2-iminopropanoate deaminase